MVGMKEASVEARMHLAAITNWQVGCKDRLQCTWSASVMEK